MNQRVKNSLREILSILFTAALWGLQMLPDKSGNSFVSLLIEYVFYIALILAISMCIPHVYRLILPGNDDRTRDWAVQIMANIAEKHLGGEMLNTRISILRPKYGFRIILPYLLHEAILMFFQNFKWNRWHSVLKNIPIHPFTEYLVVFARYEKSSKGKSYTHFKITSSPHEDCNSVAVKTFNDGYPVNVQTKNINDFDLPAKYTELEGGLKKKVDKYMNDSCIGKDHYYTLTMMNSKANNIYSVPISQKESQKIWGVLIFDNYQNEARDFQSELSDVIQVYLDTFRITLSSIK